MQNEKRRKGVRIMENKDKDDEYIPVEKLNTRVETYQKPTLRERIQSMKDRARPHIAKARAQLQAVKDRRASVQEMRRRNEKTISGGQRQQAKANVQRAMTARTPDRLNPFLNPQVNGLQNDPRGSGGVMAQGKNTSVFMQDSKKRDNGIMSLGGNRSGGGVFAGNIRERKVSKQKKGKTIVIKL